MPRAHLQAETPHTGESSPEPNPIGWSLPRIDCELMNHLNVIIGFAELLAESDHLDEPHRRYASHIAAFGARACVMLRAFFKEHRAGLGRDECSSPPAQDPGGHWIAGSEP